MKIDKAIRDAHAEQKVLNELVEQNVLEFRNRFDRHWHFTHRLKSEESYAQKIEAGLANEMVIDDFFACTIVVRNSNEISQASELVETLFDVRERRPESPNKTRDRPTEFHFDDLRLYTTLRPGYSGHRPINDVLFEIQIKTFLQHAWGIATHDLTYKTDEVKWSKMRVAYQIRAMLEHAELSIEQFDRLAQSDIIAKENSEYMELDYIIDQLKNAWQQSALPKDLQRLAKTIQRSARILQVPVEDMFRYLTLETSRGKGALSLDLSPLGAIIQSALANHKLDLKKILNKNSGKRNNQRIMISRSVEIPANAEKLINKIIFTY